MTTGRTAQPLAFEAHRLLRCIRQHLTGAAGGPPLPACRSPRLCMAQGGMRPAQHLRSCDRSASAPRLQGAQRRTRGRARRPIMARAGRVFLHTTACICKTRGRHRHTSHRVPGADRRVRICLRAHLARVAAAPRPGPFGSGPWLRAPVRALAAERLHQGLRVRAAADAAHPKQHCACAFKPEGERCRRDTCDAPT